MDRLAGVMLIGLLSSTLGILLFAASGYGAIWMSKTPAGGDSWGLAPYLAGAFVTLMVVVFCIGVLFFVLGVGLLNMRKWARSLMVALAYVNLSWVALGILGFLSRIVEMFQLKSVAPSFFTSGTWVAILLTAVAVDGWLVFYLSRPLVKQAFGEKDSPHPRPLA